MKTKIKSVLPAIIICLISLAVEMLLSNFVWFSYVAGKDNVREYVPENLSEVYLDETDPSFAMSGIDFPVNSVSFSVKKADEAAEETLLPVNFYIADENNTTVAALARSERIAAGSEERRATVYISSYGDASYIDITFADLSEELIVTDIVVNPTYKFSFDMLRFALIFTLLVFVYVMKTGGTGKRIRAEMTFRQAAVISAAICSAAAVTVWIFGLSGETGNYIIYPLERGVESYSPYIQQFDAFMKGQLHLDVQPSAELLALENPYSPGERNGISYLFDRAFYDGKYYSYFGIAPIITVYLPFYLLTGGLPTDSTVMGIFSLVTAVLLPLAVIEWSKLRGKNLPWISAVCGIGAYFASMILLIQRGRAPFYYIASIAGMAFVSAFLFFAVKALQSKRRFVKTILMVLAGVSFGLGFLSRINSVLPVSFAIAVFIIIYAVQSFKEKKIKAFIGEMAALGLPVAAALAFSLCYNYARFGNPLQFGTDYQLTVANASSYELYPGGIIPAIFHYFIQPFEISDQFPYIQLDFLRLGDYGRSLYIDSSFGIFAVPFMLSLFLSPVLFKSDKVSKNGKILLSVSLISMAVTAFADLCLGGVIFRYTSDILLFAAFVSAAVLLEFCSLMQEKYGNGIASAAKKGVTVIAVATAAVSLATAVMLNGNLVPYNPDIYIALREFFVFWS